MKWEYLTYRLINHIDNISAISLVEHYTHMLNNYGSVGWELVSVDNGIAYFKRPLRTKSEDEIMKHFDTPVERARDCLV